MPDWIRHPSSLGQMPCERKRWTPDRARGDGEGQVLSFNSSPGFWGRGTAKRGGGALFEQQSPSTMLRMVPLPSKCRGGITSAYLPPPTSSRLR